MKTPRLLVAFFAAITTLLILLGGQSEVQASEPAPITVSTLGHMTISVNGVGIDVTSQYLRGVTNPKSTSAIVPVEAASRGIYTGFRTGFGITPSLHGVPITADKLTVTGATCRIYRLNVATGIETLLENGEVAPATYAYETTNAPRPCVSTLSGPGCTGGFTNPPAAIQGTEVSNVGTLLFTRQDVTWGPNIPAPGLNEGYVVRWSVSFVITESGVSYPETSTETAFVYKVVKFQPADNPQIVTIQPPSPTAKGYIVFQGGWVRNASLQISPNAKLNSTWVALQGVATTPTKRTDIGPDAYQWDLGYATTPPKAFFRLTWGERQLVP